MKTEAACHFPNAHRTWWRKPLVLFEGKPTTAELAILAKTCKPGERGAWMNSRGTKTGVARLLPDSSKPSRFRTERVPLPQRVSEQLIELYQVTGLSKGCPDLVIWGPNGSIVRLIEVKRHRHDVESKEQKQFMAAVRRPITCETVEWTFDNES